MKRRNHKHIEREEKKKTNTSTIHINKQSFLLASLFSSHFFPVHFLSFQFVDLVIFPIYKINKYLKRGKQAQRIPIDVRFTFGARSLFDSSLGTFEFRVRMAMEKNERNLDILCPKIVRFSPFFNMKLFKRVALIWKSIFNMIEILLILQNAPFRLRAKVHTAYVSSRWSVGSYPTNTE